MQLPYGYKLMVRGLEGGEYGKILFGDNFRAKIGIDFKFGKRINLNRWVNKLCDCFWSKIIPQEGGESGS